MKKQEKTIVYNIAFLVICGRPLIFIIKAPSKTTSYLPDKDDHNKFMVMGKKHTIKLCHECHSPAGVDSLQVEHPPQYRCLSCHKQEQRGSD